MPPKPRNSNVSNNRVFIKKPRKASKTTTNRHQPTIVEAQKASAQRWIRAIGCIGDRSRVHYREYFYRPSERGEYDPAQRNWEAACVRNRGDSGRKGNESRRDSSPRSGHASASGSIELSLCVTCLPPPVSCRKAWLRFCGLRARASAGRKRSVTPPGVYVETPTQKDHPPPKREDPGGYEKSPPRYLSRQAFLKL